MAPALRRPSARQGSGHLLVLLAVAGYCAFQGSPWSGAGARAPGLALVESGEGGYVEAGFVTKVVGAAAQGATAATVAALLSAVTEPVVNRLLVKRMTFSQAMAEINFKLVSTFFLTTFPTNMLKFPVFEVINMALTFTTLAGQVRGIVNGLLFCTIMLPVTNYRFRKSMGWEIKAALLYQAYIPTVTRDIVYGWARSFVGGYISASFTLETPLQKAVAFGITIFAACIISSPGNEWRGYTLQPKDRKLPFAEYFKPINYVRSTGIGATIMGIALSVGMLVTPYAEMLFAFMKAHLLLTGGVIVLGGVVAGALKGKR